MKRLSFLFRVGFILLSGVLFSCHPGERPAGSSSSETALDDSVAVHYGDTGAARPGMPQKPASSEEK